MFPRFRPSDDWADPLERDEYTEGSGGGIDCVHELEGLRSSEGAKSRANVPRK